MGQEKVRENNSLRVRKKSGNFGILSKSGKSQEKINQSAESA